MDYPLKLQPSPPQIFTPTNVAIFASLGLHSIVLGFFLPNLLGNSNADQGNKQNVGVIELTDAEQSRLPETSPFSNAPLPPNGTAFLPNTALPNDPLAANPDVKLPDISQPPLPNQNYNYGALPSQIPLPPLPALPSYPPNLPPLSSYNNLNNFPIAQSPVSLPPLRPSSRSSERPSLPPLPNTPSYFRSIEGNNGNTDTPRPNFGTLPSSRGTGFITTAPQNPLENNSPRSLPQPELQADGHETTSEQAMRNDLEWRAKQANQQNSNGNNIGVLNLVGAYPRAACRTQTEARVVYNVDPSGAITPIQTSRYSIFNQLAQQSFQSQRFNQPTRVIVDFKYDPKVCASTVAAPNLPTETSPRLPSLPGNSLETVSPVNDPTRNIQQLPPLVPGSNRLPPSTTEGSTRQNTAPLAPSRILSPKPPNSSQSQPVPSPDSAPSSVIKTSPSAAPTNPTNSTEYGPSPLGTKNPPLELKPDEKPEVKPDVKPMTDNNSPAQTNSTEPIKSQPDEAKPSLTPKAPSPAATRNQPESKRSRLEQMINKRDNTPRKLTTPPSDPNPSFVGPVAPTKGNLPVGPSVGKKE